MRNNYLKRLLFNLLTLALLILTLDGCKKDSRNELSFTSTTQKRVNNINSVGFDTVKKEIIVRLPVALPHEKLALNSVSSIQNTDPPSSLPLPNFIARVTLVGNVPNVTLDATIKSAGDLTIKATVLFVRTYGGVVYWSVNYQYIRNFKSIDSKQKDYSAVPL